MYHNQSINFNGVRSLFDRTFARSFGTLQLPLFNNLEREQHELATARAGSAPVLTARPTSADFENYANARPRKASQRINSKRQQQQQQQPVTTVFNYLPLSMRLYNTQFTFLNVGAAETPLERILDGFGGLPRGDGRTINAINFVVNIRVVALFNVQQFCRYLVRQTTACLST